MEENTKGEEAQPSPAGIVAVAVVAILIVGLIGFSFIQSRGSTQNTAEKHTELLFKSENAKATYLKSVLDSYYIANQEYPASLDGLGEYDKTSQEEGTSFEEIVSSLNDLDYSRRGDKQAFVFTYTDANGESTEVKGEFKVEYQ